MTRFAITARLEGAGVPPKAAQRAAAPDGTTARRTRAAQFK